MRIIRKQWSGQASMLQENKLFQKCFKEVNDKRLNLKYNLNSMNF